MFICSGVPGNDCQPMTTPIENFNTYHECAIYGYEYSTELLKDFSPDFVDSYQAFTVFHCKENQLI